MPIYEYQCRSCGKEFERLCFPSDGDAKVDCPACGSKEAEKLLSAFCSVSSGSSEGAAASGAASAHSCASHSGFS